MDSKIFNNSYDTLYQESLKGTMLIIYFRWMIIGLLSTLLIFQAVTGHFLESIHSFYLILFYTCVNALVYMAAKSNYDPLWIRYISGSIDIGIVVFHISFLTTNFDSYAIAGAATILLIPLMLLLYTFKLDPKLILYLIIYSAIAYSLAYFNAYYNNPEFYEKSLSLSPISHIFKTTYLIFTGLICIYLQRSYKNIIDKKVEEINKRNELDTLIQLEKQKNSFANDMIEKERILNRELELEINKKNMLALNLREKTEQLNSIFSNLSGSAYRCLPDEDWTMIFISEKIYDICGYSAEDFLEKKVSYKDVMYHKDRKKVIDYIYEKTRNKETFEIEYRVRTKKGDVIWVNESGQGIFGNNDALLYLDGIIIDINDKKIAEENLKETKELVNSLISNLVGAASRCLYDDKLTVKYYSEKIYDITGYKPVELIDNKAISFSEIIHPDDLELVKENVTRAIESKSHYTFEYRIFHKQGNVVWLQENGKPIFDENGDVLYLDGITTDVTEHKLAEIALKESEEKYRELMDFLPQTVYELDNAGNLIYVNKIGEDIFGKGIKDNSGKVAANQFIVEEDREKMANNIKARMEGRITTEYHEYTAINKDGVRFPVLIYGAPMFKNGNVVGTRGIILDITELKKTEESLSKAKKQLEELNKGLENEIEIRTKELTEANTKLIQLQKENLQSQFEVLKQQVNPHFLFNSLNVLTSLIKLEPDLAESFTEKLSKVYRYVLENKEKDMVSLSTELDFLKAYVFLLDIRFMGKVFVNLDIDGNTNKNDWLIIPMALQLLIENAIKHNTFSKSKPLFIKLEIDENDFLVVTNNIQIRETQIQSTGVGLANIKSRYELITGKKPVFEKTSEEFTAKIPLIKVN